MKYTFSLEQRSRTGNLDAKFILRQHKLDLMARFMETKSVNPKMKRKEIARELGFSSSTLQPYRQDIKMISPYKSNNLQKCQMIAIDLKTTSNKNVIPVS